jgi:septal ring factor EnvC (AmiA/AmiB activator)
LAVAKGRVVYANWFKGYGKLIMIDHGNNIYSLYANLKEIFVKPKEIVQKATIIGRTKEGKNSYFHFEIRVNGEAIDPLSWLSR